MLFASFADFYGVTSDSLLGLTENRDKHPFPVDELGLDDETVDLLKSGKLNVRLICEMIKHPDFINFLSDMEIYVDNLAGMQFRNINKMLEQTRVRLQNKGISDEDHYMKTLKAATISEDNYFNNLLGNDIIKIAKDIRDAHSKDAEIRVALQNVGKGLERIWIHLGKIDFEKLAVHNHLGLSGIVCSF